MYQGGFSTATCQMVSSCYGDKRTKTGQKWDRRYSRTDPVESFRNVEWRKLSSFVQWMNSTLAEKRGSVSASIVQAWRLEVGGASQTHAEHLEASWGGPAAGRSSVTRPLACTTPDLPLWPVPRPGGRVQPPRTEYGKGPPSKKP